LIWAATASQEEDSRQLSQQLPKDLDQNDPRQRGRGV